MDRPMMLHGGCLHTRGNKPLPLCVLGGSLPSNPPTMVNVRYCWQYRVHRRQTCFRCAAGFSGNVESKVVVESGCRKQVEERIAT